MYGEMASYVERLLHIRAGEILDTWSVPELIVTYGNYANEETQKNFNDWKNLDSKQRMQTTRPQEYAVYFRGVM